MRGIVSLHVLMALLEKIRELTGRPDLRFDDHFDLMIGTSTGGIIVVGMCVAKKSLEELVDLYQRLGSSIFGDASKINGFKPSILARYGDRRLMELLLDVVGTRRLDDPDVAASDSRTHIGVTTVDISWNPARPYVLRNYGVEDTRGTNKVFAAECVRCTTAASAFLLPYAFNVGTGEMPSVRNASWNVSETRPADSPLLGKKGMRIKVTDLIMGAFVDPATETAETNYERKEEYGDSRICIQRINPRLSRHFPLDTVDMPSLKQMIEDTNEWLAGPEDSAAINAWAVDIVAYSEKLKRAGSFKTS